MNHNMGEKVMRNTHRCPKCGETRLIYIPGKAGVYGTGNNIMTGMTIFSAVLVNRYVCIHRYVNHTVVCTLIKTFLFIVVSFNIL